MEASQSPPVTGTRHRRPSQIPILFIDDDDDVDPRRRLFSSPTVSAEPEVALALARGQRRRLQAAAAAAAAEAEAAVAAEAEAEAAVEASPESSPDLPRPPPADRVIRTLTRSTESFTLLEVAVRLVGRKGGTCVRVPIRRAWAWSVCLAEVQSRLLEASAIGEDEQVSALRATAPPHARVVRAADLAPGEVLEALLRVAGSAAEASPQGSAREDAETPRAALAPPRFDEVASLVFGETYEEEEASNLVHRRHIKRDVE